MVTSDVETCSVSPVADADLELRGWGWGEGGGGEWFVLALLAFPFLTFLLFYP